MIGWIQTPQYILLKTIKDLVEAAVAVAAAAAASVLFPWLTWLQHGTIQFKSVSTSPGAQFTNITSDEESSTAIDRKFVYFPAGYFSQSDNALQETLHALGLYMLPNLLIVSAATDGVIEEQVVTGDECKNDETLTLGVTATTLLCKQSSRGLMLCGKRL